MLVVVGCDTEGDNIFTYRSYWAGLNFNLAAAKTYFFLKILLDVQRP